VVMRRGKLGGSALSSCVSSSQSYAAQRELIELTKKLDLNAIVRRRGRTMRQYEVGRAAEHYHQGRESEMTNQRRRPTRPLTEL
jgi:hypothetical protein